MTVAQAIHDVLEDSGLPLYGQINVDSLELVQLLLQLETKLGRDLDVKQLTNVVTVDDLTAIVTGLVREQGHSPACPSPGKDCTCSYSELFWQDVTDQQKIVVRKSDYGKN